MNGEVTIGIIGDFDARPSHLATNEAIEHAAFATSIDVEVHWLPTALLLLPDAEGFLERCDGLWAAPGSPYDSLDGALAGIRFARERGRPFAGT